MHKDSQSKGDRLVVLGTGGTISGSSAVGSDNIGYTTGVLDVNQLFAGIDAPEGFTLQAEQVAQLDSKDMDFGTWQRLAQRCIDWLAQPDIAGIVITHGTDTLEETAFFLQAVVNPVKPVVLTCAMRPATALAPDGPQNMRDALVVAATREVSGVMVVCAGVVHGACDVQKVHTYRLDAFSSGDAGPIGFVEEGAVRFVRHCPVAANAGVPVTAALTTEPVDWPKVEIVMSHAGVRGTVVEALMQPSPSTRAQSGVTTPMVDGLVVAATGNGTIHFELEKALLLAQARGIRIVRSTRCPEGRIFPRQQENFQDAGALTPVKARIALLVELLSRQQA